MAACCDNPVLRIAAAKRDSNARPKKKAKIANDPLDEEQLEAEEGH